MFTIFVQIISTVVDKMNIKRRKYIAKCKKRPDGRWNEKLGEFEKGFYRKKSNGEKVWIPAYLLTPDSPFKIEKGQLLYIPNTNQKKKQKEERLKRLKNSLENVINKVENNKV